MKMFIYSINRQRFIVVKKDRQEADAAIRDTYGRETLTAATKGLVETFSLENGIICHFDVE